LAAWHPPKTGRPGRSPRYADIAIETGHLLRLAALRAQGAAWYDKHDPTFSDAIAAVRRALWCPPHFSMSRPSQGTIEIATTPLHRLVQTVAYAAWRPRKLSAGSIIAPTSLRNNQRKAELKRRLQNLDAFLPKVIQGITFRDGVEVIDTLTQNAAWSGRHPDSNIGLI
jgi:hypothetical protein